ncbi:hypothetical protein JCM10450v2_004800 [Rhodotorula kratochvilovae]
MPRPPSSPSPTGGYTALPLAPGAPTPPHARRTSQSVLAALAHTHRRALVLLGVLALLLGGGAAMHPARSRGEVSGEVEAAREGWRVGREPAAAAAREGATGGSGGRGKWFPAPVPARHNEPDDEAGDISFAEAEVDRLAALREAEGDVDAPPETDGADDEAGLSRAKGKGKAARPFGQAGAAAAAEGDDDFEPVDGSYGEDYLPSVVEVDDDAAGTAHGDADEADLLADMPGFAAQGDAAARAPMAAVAPAHKDASAGGAEEGATEGAGHAAAKAEFARPPPPSVVDAADPDPPREDDAADVPRPKIGTGGRLGSGAVAELKPANRVGAGAMAGALVKEEAGRRVGV